PHLSGGLTHSFTLWSCVAGLVLPLHNLAALALELFAGCALSGIAAAPASPGGQRNVAGFQQVNNRFWVALICRGELARKVVLNEHGGGVFGIGLGVANQTNRTALNPAGGVQARDGFTSRGVDDVAAVVGDNGLLVIERHALDVLWVVANRAVDRLDWPIGELTGAGDIAVAVELRALGADGNDLAVFAQDFRRGLEEVDVELVRGIARLAHGVA